jgi:PH domain
MTQLCVQSGWLLKRNEQRVWQPRYCVTVPKTYLYYFETEDALQPRGIIDLEWYTDIATEQTDNSLIVLSPSEMQL